MKEAEILEYLGSLPDNDVYLPMLVDQMQTSVGVVPFIGAGMSAPFGYPQWTAFLCNLAQRRGIAAAIDQRIAEGKYEEAAEDLISALGPSHFQDLIEHFFGDRVLNGKQISGALTLIPRLSSGPVITTNFDKVLEKVFRETSCPFADVVWHSKVNLAVPAFAENKAVLLKIHGDWQDPENRVLTLSEYKKNYGDPDAAIDFALPLPRLLDLLSTHPVLFLGCSLNQDRTVAILKRIAGDLPTSRHYAIVEKPADEAKARERGDYLESKNIRPIWYRAGEHDRIETLLGYLAEQVPAAFRRAALKTAVAAGAAAQAAAAAPAPAAQPVDSIPRPLTSFIGRELERKQLQQQLLNGGLLTLTGAPGAGKTRLAIELARSVHDDFGKVWFVELSQLQETEYVPQRVATVLGIREQASRPPTEVLAEFLRSGKYLVILDNCEHVIEACTALADYLLRNCPTLTILATSRQVLRVDGEQLYVIPPLELPDPEQAYDLSDLAEIDSVELLLARARTRSNFKLTAENAAAVAALCRELEGIPLAIELAAAQLDTLTVDQILEELNQRLELLAGGAGGAVERQWATLEEAIRFSHRRLDDKEKLLFRRLAVFHHGWTWDAATAVCSEPNQNKFDILRLLNQLYRVSLLVIEEGNGQKRFRLYDSIREFARRELVEAGEQAAIGKRHAEWFVQLAEMANPELLKKDQVHWLNALAVEADNLRAAILWSVGSRFAETALRLVASLWRLTEIRGYYREGVQRLQMVLRMPEADAYPALRSKTLSGLGILAYRQGDITSAEKCFRESLEIEEKAANLPGIANSLNDLGNVAKTKGDFEEARDLYQKSLAIERQTKNPRGISVALFNLGDTARRLGRVDEADGLLQESAQTFEAEGNLREAAFPLNALGWLNLARGDLAAAESFAGKSLQIRQDKDLADKKGVSDTLRTIAAIRARQGRLEEAHKRLTESADLACGLNDKRGIAETLEGFASLAAIKREFASCVALYAASETIRGEIHIPLAPIERHDRDSDLEAARAALGSDEFERRHEAGSHWSTVDALHAPAKPPGPAVLAAAQPI